MLSNEGIPSLEVFSDDNIVALDKWSKKFMERIKVYGARLSEEEKLNRLSIFLDDTPKQIFEELSPAKRTTCEQALKSIREELDSPQRRSLSRQALLICKQQENETVKEFLTRFRPLALATAVDMAGTHRERYLCDLLLERLLPNIAFCMKLLNFTQNNRGFEQLCMDAREVEIMIPGRSNPLFPTASVNEMQEVNQYVGSQGPSGRFKTLNPINSNRVQPREGWRFNQTNDRNFKNRQINQQRSWSRPNQRMNNWNRNPSNDRRWNNRPMCNYCSRTI
ncbi:unnamed protein product [Meloidogyne enterolobii]|uniref:Uncharacterized protein n=1 Tax=Meloidogyne enterolobii TaxID=390850 RepID=A0ACB0ZAT6_MELEN